MYPYKRRLQWWISGRHAHLVKGLEQEKELYAGVRGDDIKSRVRGVKRFLVVRLVALIVLSFSAVASIILFLLDGASPEAADLLRRLAWITSNLAGLFTLVYLFAMRTLAQLEIDILLLRAPKDVRQ